MGRSRAGEEASLGCARRDKRCVLALSAMASRPPADIREQIV